MSCDRRLRRAGARYRQPAVVAGARRARRPDGAAGSARRQHQSCSLPRSILFSPRFGDHVIAAAGVSAPALASVPGRAAFAPRPRRRALRHKEWTLLRRDPWLMSQTLMQILYLLPPGLLLWRSFERGGALLVLVPVLVMAAGQLAGGSGLAGDFRRGRAGSGRDCAGTRAGDGARQDRSRHGRHRDRVLAVHRGARIPLAPFHAVVAALGIVAAAASAIQIQLWFRSQAKRSQFRHRLISSRTAALRGDFPRSLGLSRPHSLLPVAGMLRRPRRRHRNPDRCARQSAPANLPTARSAGYNIPRHSGANVRLRC